MKKTLYSIPIKILLQFLLFISALFTLLSASAIVKYFDHYNLNESFTQTIDFEERYGKYIERVAAYIQYRERGFVSLSPSYGDFAAPVDNYYFIADTDEDQKVYDFYDKKLNFDQPNFLYYVKNLDTGSEYYSPHLKEYAADYLKKNIQTEKEAVECFIKNIEKNPAYFILNTKSMVYSTNVNNWGYISATNVDWVVQCITGRLNAGNSLITAPAAEPSQPTTGLISAETEDDSKYDFLLYTCVVPDFSLRGDDFNPLYHKYQTISADFDASRILLPLSIVLFLSFFLLTIAACGHSNEKPGIRLLRVDHIWSEFSLLGLIVIPLIIFVGISILMERIPVPQLFQSKSAADKISRITSQLPLKQLLNGSDSSYILIQFACIYPCVAILFYSFIRRFKSHTIISSSLLYKVWKMIKKTWRYFIENKNLTFSAGIYFVVFFVMIILSAVLFRDFFFLSALLLILCFCCGGFWLFRAAADLNTVMEETRQIAQGDLGHKIPDTIGTIPLKNLGKYINHIGDGLTAAVEEKLKSERLKTELITNVSHDIKTPLTSIINYVDILKKQDIDNEAAQNYIHVLEAKSWRLKTLIEDLVEASKASSGTIQMVMEKLNIVELVRQMTGEFDDRFQDNHLEPVLNIEKDPIYILADGRSTFRIMENLFSNANKYALPGTRIYIDIVINSTQVSVSIKNISAQKLNIPSEELMERFVRGDIARSTEGSGLGLSIAKSLAALMDADFKVLLDGDLFKAVLTFQIIPQDWQAPEPDKPPAKP